MALIQNLERPRREILHNDAIALEKFCEEMESRESPFAGAGKQSCFKGPKNFTAESGTMSQYVTFDGARLGKTNYSQDIYVAYKWSCKPRRECCTYY